MPPVARIPSESGGHPVAASHCSSGRQPRQRNRRPTPEPGTRSAVLIVRSRKKRGGVGIARRSPTTYRCSRRPPWLPSRSGHESTRRPPTRVQPLIDADGSIRSGRALGRLANRIPVSTAVTSSEVIASRGPTHGCQVCGSGRRASWTNLGRSSWGGREGASSGRELRGRMVAALADSAGRQL
jgi:hypothetical protein